MGHSPSGESLPQCGLLYNSLSLMGLPCLSVVSSTGCNPFGLSRLWHGLHCSPQCHRVIPTHMWSPPPCAQVRQKYFLIRASPCRSVSLEKCLLHFSSFPHTLFTPQVSFCHILRLLWLLPFLKHNVLEWQHCKLPCLLWWWGPVGCSIACHTGCDRPSQGSS